MEYLQHIATLIGIYVILSVSLDLITGYTGLLSVAHAAFYAVGAYVAALMALEMQTPFLANVACAIALSGVLGAIVGVPALRIRDDYFVIATFAFQAIAFSILNNWVSVTRGPLGLPGIPRPTVFGLSFSANSTYLLLIACLVAVALWISHRIGHSPFGRMLKAIREDEVFAQAAGKDVAHCKVLIFIVGAGMAAVAGVIYAHYMTFIDPGSFTVMESVLILSMVIIGGAGNMWGSVLGAVVLVVLPELLRYVGLPVSLAANVRQMLYGALLVALMLWRPQGFLGEYTFQKGGSKT